MNKTVKWHTSLILTSPWSNSHIELQGRLRNVVISLVAMWLATTKIKKREMDIGRQLTVFAINRPMGTQKLYEIFFLRNGKRKSAVFR